MMWRDGRLPNVGPTSETGPFNITQKVGGMLNELETAHIFIAQQQETIDALGAHVATLNTRFAALEAQLQK